MILYHAITTYHLLNCIVHKEKYYKNQKCAILLSEFIKEKFPFYHEMKGVFFDEIFMYANAGLHKNVDEIKENTNEVFNDFFETHNLDLSNCSQIIVSCAHSFFGIYLVINGHQFVLMEEASGILSRPEVVEEIEERLLLSKYLICKEMGLYTGDNSLIVKKIYNKNTQLPGFSADNLEHFDVVTELGENDEEFRNKVLSFFGVSRKIVMQENSTLVLTQHFANLKILSWEEQLEIYQLAVDYFAAESNLVFKPHPADDLMPYEHFFLDASVVKTKFPSELIPFIFTNPPSRVLTITSTAVSNLKTYLPNIIEFSFVFEKKYRIVHKYYCALWILSKVKDLNEIQGCGVEQSVLNNLLLFSDIQLECNFKEVNNILDVSGNNLVLIDDFNCDDINEGNMQRFLHTLGDDSIAVFINSNKRYLFFNYPSNEAVEYLVPVDIRVMCVNEQVSSINEHNECIYFYSKKREVRDMISQMVFEKNLPHSGKKLQINAMSEEQLKIKLLEGVLEATEKRLEHYIQLEAELREELKKQR